jgi:Rrf2 family transcriptional regulator, cysteine metabolism repressor
MKLSTRSRYGMRALLDLAMNSTGLPVQLKDIAERQSLSLSYLEHLIIPLIGAGLIKSIRGAKGGIMLAKTPQQIQLKEILEVLEGPLDPVDCLKDLKGHKAPGGCPRSGACATQEIWDDMKKAMENVLESRTLQDLINRQKSKESQPTSMYYI